MCVHLHLYLCPCLCVQRSRCASNADAWYALCQRSCVHVSSGNCSLCCVSSRGWRRRYCHLVHCGVGHLGVCWGMGGDGEGGVTLAYVGGWGQGRRRGESGARVWSRVWSLGPGRGWGLGHGRRAGYCVLEVDKCRMRGWQRFVAARSCPWGSALWQPHNMCMWMRKSKVYETGR